MNTLMNKRLKMKPIFCLAAVLLLAMIFSGCLTDNPFSNTNTGIRDGAQPSSNANNTSAPQKASGAEQVLEAKYYEDADGDVIPDFIEIELGKDPNNAEHCPVDTSKCGGAGSGADVDLNVNTLLILDSSGSMNAMTGGVTRLEAAKTALMNYVAQTSKPVKMGFLVYGHKGNNTAAGKPESCAEAGAELLDEIGTVSRDTFQSSLDKFQPTGWTPIAVALSRAEQAFAGMEGKNNHIVMVSDGLETCGGNPVEVARRLHEQGIRVTIDVVGFGAGAVDVKQLKQIAAAGGGDYFDAKTSSDLNDYLTKQMKASTKTMESGNCFAIAYNDANLCDSNFVNQVNEIINRAKQADWDEYQKNQDYTKYDAFSKRQTAYQDLKTRIDAARIERQKKRENVRGKADELYEKSRELDKQLQDNYNKNK